MIRYRKLLKEYARSDDVWDVLGILQSGQSIVMIVYDNGDQEFMDEEFYSEEGKDTMMKKTRGKQVAKIFKITADEIMG